MKITENKSWTGRSYQIAIEPEDNLEPMEIGECFMKQYPKEMAVIVFKEVIIKLGVLFVGLKIPHKNKRQKKKKSRGKRVTFYVKPKGSKRKKESLFSS